MAIWRVVICWLEVHLLDSEYPGGVRESLQQARLVELLKTNAQKRHDQAVKSLLLIREKFAAGVSLGPPSSVTTNRAGIRLHPRRTA